MAKELATRRIGVFFQNWRDRRKGSDGRRRQARGLWKLHDRDSEWLGGPTMNLGSGESGKRCGNLCSRAFDGLLIRQRRRRNRDAMGRQGGRP